MKKLLTLALLFMMVGIVYALPPIEIAKDKYLKITYEGQFGLSYRDIGSGYENDQQSAEFNFNRNRINFIGTWNDWISYYFQTEYLEQKRIGALSVSASDGGRNFYVLDAQIRLAPADYFKVTLGKMKHNLTRENLEDCSEPLTFDRSLFIDTPYKASSTRDVGIAVWGNLAGGLFQYRLDAMNGHTNTYADPRPGGSLARYTGRFQASFFDPEADYGMAGSYLGEKQVLTVGAAYQYEPKAIYGDIAGNDKVYDYSAYSFDIFYEQPAQAGTFTFSAAYLDISFADAYKEANPGMGSYGLNGQKNGWYVKGGYLLPMDIGPGMLQFFGRYDDFEFANLYNTVTATDFYNQRVTRVGVGANYYIDGHDLKVTLEYYTTKFDKSDPNDPNYNDFNGFDLFLQVRI